MDYRDAAIKNVAYTFNLSDAAVNDVFVHLETSPNPWFENTFSANLKPTKMALHYFYYSVAYLDRMPPEPFLFDFPRLLMTTLDALPKPEWYKDVFDMSDPTIPLQLYLAKHMLVIDGYGLGWLKISKDEGLFEKSFPNSFIVPESGEVNPLSMSIVVDFPAPFTPSKP